MKINLLYQKWMHSEGLKTSAKNIVTFPWPIKIYYPILAPFFIGWSTLMVHVWLLITNLKYIM
jgi:hypothetical protein